MRGTIDNKQQIYIVRGITKNHWDLIRYLEN